VTVVGSNWSAGYTLTTDLNLFNGLADYSGLRSSLLKKDSADLTLERARQRIALDIAQAYLQVVLDNRLVDIARKNLQQSQARERLLTEQTKVGARNLSDLFRQQALTSADESSLLTAQNKTRTDQILFLRRLRADVAKKYHFVEPRLSDGQVNPRYENEAELLKTALERRADLKASYELADALEWDAKSAFSGYLPKLDLLGGVIAGGRYWDTLSVNNAASTPPVQTDVLAQLGSQVSYAVSLNLSWAIFDRLVTHQGVVRSRMAADNARIDAQDRRNQVEGEVRQSYGDYKTAIQQLRASKKGLEAAQKAYEVMEGRYEVGSASFVDLVTVQAALVQAESARAQALIDFELQGRALALAVGE
jgi:outer membrane protein